MQDDPIVEEVRKVREAYAAKLNYDLEAIFQGLKRQERKSGRTFVSYPPRRISKAPGKETLDTAKSTGAAHCKVSRGAK
jgi:hypothetical protein